jgi:CRISPR type III-B/RAMP module-associated protein Cmr5
MQTRSQRYSDKVFNSVQNYIDGEIVDLQKRKYKSLCKRAGGVLRTVGLIQFLTFLAASKSKEVQHGFLLEHIRLELSALGIMSCVDENAFLKNVRQTTLASYMKLTTDVLTLLQWHKRICDVLIEGTADEED